MIFSGIILILACCASVKNATTLAPGPAPPPPSFDTTVLKVVDSVDNIEVATVVEVKEPPPLKQGFSAVIAKAWELDPRSSISSTRDRPGVVRRVHFAFTNASIPLGSEAVNTLSDIHNINFTKIRRQFEPRTGPLPPPPPPPSKPLFPSNSPPFPSHQPSLSPPLPQWRKFFERAKENTAMVYQVSMRDLSRLDKIWHSNLREVVHVSCFKAAKERIVDASLAISSGAAIRELMTTIKEFFPERSRIVEEGRIVLEKSLIEVAIGQIPAHELPREIYKNARNRCGYIVSVSIAERIFLKKRAVMHQAKDDPHQPPVPMESWINSKLDELEVKNSENLELSSVGESNDNLEHSLFVGDSQETSRSKALQQGLVYFNLILKLVIGYSHAFRERAFYRDMTFGWFDVFLCANTVIILISVLNYLIVYRYERKRSQHQRKRRRKRSVPKKLEKTIHNMHVQADHTPSG